MTNLNSASHSPSISNVFRYSYNCPIFVRSPQCSRTSALGNGLRKGKGVEAWGSFSCKLNCALWVSEMMRKRVLIVCCGDEVGKVMVEARASGMQGWLDVGKFLQAKRCDTLTDAGTHDIPEHFCLVLERVVLVPEWVVYHFDRLNSRECKPQSVGESSTSVYTATTPRTSFKPLITPAERNLARDSSGKVAAKSYWSHLHCWNLPYTYPVARREPKRRRPVHEHVSKSDLRRINYPIRLGG